MMDILVAVVEAQEAARELLRQRKQEKMNAPEAPPDRQGANGGAPAQPAGAQQTRAGPSPGVPDRTLSKTPSVRFTEKDTVLGRGREGDDGGKASGADSPRKASPGVWQAAARLVDALLQVRRLVCYMAFHRGKGPTA